jgi:uncharacterized membrane protein
MQKKKRAARGLLIQSNNFVKKENYPYIGTLIGCIVGIVTYWIYATTQARRALQEMSALKTTVELNYSTHEWLGFVIFLSITGLIVGFLLKKKTSLQS